MKGVEFRLKDVEKEREEAQGKAFKAMEECDALKRQLANTSRESNDSEHYAAINEALRREVERQRKKNEVSEGVIRELKKELEKYAIELIRMQE
jgi:hypothetical protein